MVYGLWYELEYFFLNLRNSENVLVIIILWILNLKVVFICGIINIKEMIGFFVSLIGY